MKILRSIRESRHPVSLYDDWRVVLLAKSNGDRNQIILYAFKHYHVDAAHKKCSTLVYSSFGHGLREYKSNEDWSVVHDYLPVEIHGAGATSKLDGVGYVWCNALLPPTAVMPPHLWQ